MLLRALRPGMFLAGIATWAVIAQPCVYCFTPASLLFLLCDERRSFRRALEVILSLSLSLFEEKNNPFDA